MRNAALIRNTAKDTREITIGSPAPFPPRQPAAGSAQASTASGAKNQPTDNSASPHATVANNASPNSAICAAKGLRGATLRRKTTPLPHVTAASAMARYPYLYISGPPTPRRPARCTPNRQVLVNRPRQASESGKYPVRLYPSPQTSEKSGRTDGPSHNEMPARGPPRSCNCAQSRPCRRMPLGSQIGQQSRVELLRQAC